MEVGDVLEVQLVHLRRDGMGLAWGKNKEMILVEGATANDNMIKVEILEELHGPFLASKIGKGKSIIKSQDDEEEDNYVDSPYETDGDDDEDEYEEEED